MVAGTNGNVFKFFEADFSVYRAKLRVNLVVTAPYFHE